MPPSTIPRTLAILLLINALALALMLPTVRALGEVPGALSQGPLLAALGASVVLSPLVALLKAGILSAIVWATAAMCDVPVALRAAFPPILLAEVALALGGPWTALVLLARGTPESMTDLAVPSGINAFWTIPPGWPTVLSEQLGLFHILWMVALAILLRDVLRASRRATALAVATCWMTGFGGALIRADLSA